MLSVFRGAQFSVISKDDTVIDVEARRVVLHCSNRVDTDAGEYTNEYIFSLIMSEDGTRNRKHDRIYRRGIHGRFQASDRFGSRINSSCQ
jgi:hypothetical protein